MAISLKHNALIIVDHTSYTDISPEVSTQLDSVRFLCYYYYTIWVRVGILIYVL
jgi:hypothetical protein